MDILQVRDYALRFPFAEETTPFDETTLVYKVCGKMFLLADMEDTGWINVKCDPDRALQLRERYAEVRAGYHMNKRHWNTVRIDGDLPEALILGWIRDSYLSVAATLPKRERETVLETFNQLHSI